MLFAFSIDTLKILIIVIFNSLIISQSVSYLSLVLILALSLHTIFSHCFFFRVSCSLLKVRCDVLGNKLGQKAFGGFPGSSVVKNPPANAGDSGDACSIPGLERSPGGGNGNLLQYSYLENVMDRGAWRATVHGVAKSWA